MPLTPHQLAPGRDEREPWATRDLGLAEHAQPPLHRDGLALGDRAATLAQTRSLGDAHVSGRERVEHGPIDVAGRSVPGARPAVKVGLQLRLAPELGAQRVADQPVIAVPLAGPVDGDHEPFASERLEHEGRVAAVHERIAERARQRVGDARAHGERQSPRQAGRPAPRRRT